MIGRTLLALALVALPAPIAAEGRETNPPPEVHVDCDAGQNLAIALRRIRDAPGATVYVRGTCVGSFVVEADDVTIRGVSAEATTLEAPAGGGSSTVLEVRGAADVVVRNFTIRGGGYGIFLHRSPGAQVLTTTFTDNVVGLQSEESLGGRVWQSDFHDNQLGISLRRRSSLNLQESDIRNSADRGVTVWERSSLLMTDSSVTGSGVHGLNVFTYSDARVLDSTFESNGSTHMFVDDRGVLTVSETTVGTPTDSTARAVLLRSEATLHSAYATFYGDFQLWTKAFARLALTQITGSIDVEDFSQVLLVQVDIDGAVTCDDGGDVLCEGVATVVAPVDCPSAPTTCTAPTAEPRAR